MIRLVRRRQAKVGFQKSDQDRPRTVTGAWIGTTDVEWHRNGNFNWVGPWERMQRGRSDVAVAHDGSDARVEPWRRDNERVQRKGEAGVKDDVQRSYRCPHPVAAGQRSKPTNQPGLVA